VQIDFGHNMSHYSACCIQVVWFKPHFLHNDRLSKIKTFYS